MIDNIRKIANSKLDSTKKADQDLPKLLNYATSLLDIVEKMLRTEPQLDEENDHLGVMIWAFVYKQVDHLSSIIALVDVGKDADAEIIARTSIEGMYLLLWSFHGPMEGPRDRSFRWRAYPWIEEWRQIVKDNAKGETIDPERKRMVEQQLQKFDDLFLTNDARDKKRKGESLPADPYIKGWPSTNLEMMIEELLKIEKLQKVLQLDKRHYDLIYRGISRWVHWDPRGIRQAIKYDGNSVFYDSRSVNKAAVSLADGFTSLLRSAELFNYHFKLAFRDELTMVATACFDDTKGTD